jgi:tRNA-dependent cyclodipeptide synthase
MRKPHVVLLGMSVGNGFFSRKRIEIAICGFARLSGDLAVIVPDSIAIHTYLALGYTESEARASVKKRGLGLKSRCRRAIELSRAMSPAKVRMLDWESDVSSQSLYQGAYAEVKRLFETHNRFRGDLLRTARSVVESKTTDSDITESALVECAHYLLKELAYFRICRDLFGMDVLIPYHSFIGVAADFCDGVYGEPVRGVGWAVYDIDLLGDTDAALGGSYVE